MIPKLEKVLIGGKQSFIQERESQIRTHAQFSCLESSLDVETAGGMTKTLSLSLILGQWYSYIHY